MGTRKIKDRGEQHIPLHGDREVLFERMRDMYPNGDEWMQRKFCLEVDESRIDHYINRVFTKRKGLRYITHESNQNIRAISKRKY